MRKTQELKDSLLAYLLALTETSLLTFTRVNASPLRTRRYLEDCARKMGQGRELVGLSPAAFFENPDTKIRVPLTNGNTSIVMKSAEAITVAVSYLDGRRIEFALVHQAALATWGVDRNAVLPIVDVLTVETLRSNDLTVVDLAAGLKLRLWTPKMLGLEGGFETVVSEECGCMVLAPELVLATIDKSPDYRMLTEPIMTLVTVLCRDSLNDEELALARTYLHLP